MYLLQPWLDRASQVKEFKAADDAVYNRKQTNKLICFSKIWTFHFLTSRYINQL